MTSLDQQFEDDNEDIHRRALRASRGRAAHGMVMVVGGGMLRGLRRLLYYVFFWLRPLVLLVRSVVVPLCGLGGAFYGFAYSWTSKPCLYLIGASLITFILAYLYDSVLLLLCPDDVELFF